MRFYTDVTRYGNQMLYRGYKNGERIRERVKFKPTLFVNGQSEWRTLDNKPVAPMQFDSMKDATEFIKQYQHIPTVKTYGTTNYMHQFITDRFPEDITFNRDQIHVTTIDIEVQSDEGFPEPDKANYPVISICTKSSKESFYRVWGLGDYTPDENTVYVKCESELQLMDTFLKYWNGHGMPDVVTGWNIKGFDIPYLVNRTRKVLGEESVKKWSIWGLVSSRDCAR